MEYQLRHLTRYDYSGGVSLSHNEARLHPRDLLWQKASDTQITIEPVPRIRRTRVDFFGNLVTYFSLQDLHVSLEVVAESRVITLPKQLPPAPFNLSWNKAANLFAQSRYTAPSMSINPEESLMLLDSSFIPTADELRQYVLEVFSPGRPIVDAVIEFNQTIFNQFAYDPEYTTIATPILDVLTNKRGVCQDFAHLAIGCLRSIGLAARYVSGYMETLPPPGQQKLQGADATHAWLAVLIPGWGWLEIDPTNGTLTDERYITLAWGRDFADVTPLKGVMNGGGNEQLIVAVDVNPVAENRNLGLL